MLPIDPNDYTPTPDELRRLKAADKALDARMLKASPFLRTARESLDIGKEEVDRLIAFYLQVEVKRKNDPSFNAVNVAHDLAKYGLFLNALVTSALWMGYAIALGNIGSDTKSKLDDRTDDPLHRLFEENK